MDSIDRIKPETLIECQQKLDKLQEYHDELEYLLNALEGAVMYRQYQKEKIESLAGQT